MTADMPDPQDVAAGVTEYDVMKIAYERFYQENPGQAWGSGSKESYIIASAAILGARAMQDAMAGRVRVKALEWSTRPAHGGGTDYVATSLVGEYLVTTCNDAVYLNNQIVKGVRGPDGAQSHYEGLLLASLEPAGAQEGSHQVAHAGDMMGDATPSHTPTPAPDVPWLVRRAHRIADDLKMLGLSTAEAEIRQAADALEALQAEVAREKLRADAEAAEVNLLTHQRDAFRRDRNLAEHRATAAEAERDALRAEVERKDKALETARRVFFFDLSWMRDFGDAYNQAVKDAGDVVSAALAPAKAGG